MCSPLAIGVAALSLLIRRTIFGAGLVASVLIVAETAAQHFGFGKPLLYQPSASAYEPVPNQVVSRLGHVTHINDLGTRGRNILPEPESGVFRILVIGDSVANGGTMVSDAETFPAQLESTLAHAGCRAEVINASAGGWSLPDEAGWLQQHGVLAADMVVLLMNQGDAVQPANTSGVLDHHPSFPSKEPRFALSEIAFRYLLPTLGFTSAEDPGSRASDGREAAAPEARAAFDLIMKLAQEGGASFALAYHQGLGSGSVRQTQILSRFFDKAKAAAAPVIQFRLNAAKDHKSLFRDAIHPNAAGNRRMAEIAMPVVLNSCKVARDHFQRSSQNDPKV